MILSKNCAKQPSKYFRIQTQHTPYICVKHVFIYLVIYFSIINTTHFINELNYSTRVANM